VCFFVCNGGEGYLFWSMVEKARHLHRRRRGGRAIRVSCFQGAALTDDRDVDGELRAGRLRLILFFEVAKGRERREDCVKRATKNARMCLTETLSPPTTTAAHNKKRQRSAHRERADKRRRARVALGELARRRRRLRGRFNVVDDRIVILGPRRQACLRQRVFFTGGGVCVFVSARVLYCKGSNGLPGCSTKSQTLSFSCFPHVHARTHV
jgi:hypothetical protein